MRTIEDVDVLGEEGLRERMLRWSLAVFAATVVLTVAALFLMPPASLLAGLVQVGIGVVASIVVLPVHELVHAAMFRLLGGRACKVSFGYEAGCLYTRTNDAVLPRVRFLAVLLAPSVVLTVVLVVLGCVAGSASAGILAAGLHLSGCTGDLLMARVILVTPEATHVQDTASGCRLLADG